MSEIATPDFGEGAGALLAGRSLEQTFPELVPLLKRGADVLDVGCGPGTITRDVARAVATGQVVGLDPVTRWTDEATAAAAQDGLENVRFVHGDAHHLELADDSFDLVYTHQALQYCLDPVMPLREQQRVARRGGRIAIKIGIGGDTFMHPRCPAIDEVDAARGRYDEYLRTRYQPGQQLPGFFSDNFPARGVVRWLAEAGLERYQIEVRPATVHPVEYPGSAAFELEPRARRFARNGARAKLYEAMIDAGFIDAATIDRAHQEAQVWYRDPHALAFAVALFVVAKVA